MRFLHYALGSLGVAALFMVRSLAQYPNYYTAMVAMVVSWPSLASLLNMMAIIFIMAGKLAVWLFLGSIMPTEWEKIQEKLFLLAFDALLMSDMLIDNRLMAFSLVFDAMLIVTLMIFHWIAVERVEFMFELADMPSWFKQCRMYSFVSLLAIVDVYLCWSSYVLATSGFKLPYTFLGSYIELMRLCATMTTKMIANHVEAHYYWDSSEDGDPYDERERWENKDLVVSSIVFVISLLALLADLALILFVGGGKSLRVGHIAYRAFNLLANAKKLLSTRNAKTKLQKYITNATAADLVREDICVVCREDMELTARKERMTPKKLSCGHVIHLGCLKSWISRSQICPTCRQPLDSGLSGFAPAGPGIMLAAPAEQVVELAANDPAANGFINNADGAIVGDIGGAAPEPGPANQAGPAPPAPTPTVAARAPAPGPADGQPANMAAANATGEAPERQPADQGTEPLDPASWTHLNVRTHKVPFRGGFRETQEVKLGNRWVQYQIV